MAVEITEVTTLMRSENITSVEVSASWKWVMPLATMAMMALPMNRSATIAMMMVSVGKSSRMRPLCLRVSSV